MAFGPIPSPFLGAVQLHAGGFQQGVGGFQQGSWVVIGRLACNYLVKKGLLTSRGGLNVEPRMQIEVSG